MGRAKKYTARTLEREIEAYFRGLRRTVTLTERVDTGERDGKGHQVFELREILNDSGEPVRVVEYAVPPTVGGLCEHLGIHRSTWADYCDAEAHPELKDVTEGARETMRSYLESELLRREGKDLKGVIFSLQNNYGMSEKRTVELGPRASAAMSAGAGEREALMKLLEEERACGGPPGDGGSGAADPDGPAGAGAFDDAAAEDGA